jgi:hypothetical protein
LAVYDRLEVRRTLGDLHVLILTRKVGEALMIGEDVTVTVMAVKGNQVRIGIKCAEGCRGAQGRNL